MFAVPTWQIDADLSIFDLDPDPISICWAFRSDLDSDSRHSTSELTPDSKGSEHEAPGMQTCFKQSEPELRGPRA
eukprot:6612138-Alexandrium_andersonii.AAC.1